MESDEYRKRLEAWTRQQAEIQKQKSSPPQYDPSKMPSRTPLGCILAAAALAAGIAAALMRLL